MSIQCRGTLTNRRGNVAFNLYAADMSAVIVDGRGTLVPNQCLTFENVLRAITVLRHGLTMPLPQGPA